MIIILITLAFYSSNIPVKYQKSNLLRRALYRSRTHRSQAEIHQSWNKATAVKRRRLDRKEKRISQMKHVWLMTPSAISSTCVVA